ncbi:hypothetical protein QTP70_003614, partial [Hemibagrus guttatus]
KGRELADMMERRKVKILCVQETKGSKARGIGAGFKLFYYGVDSKRNGVGVVLKEEFVRNVLEVKRVSDTGVTVSVMSLKLEIEGVMLNVVSRYAPQDSDEVCCKSDEEFKVEVGLHQGSALSPFLFAIVMDQLSEEVRQESPWTMMKVYRTGGRPAMLYGLETVSLGKETGVRARAMLQTISPDLLPFITTVIKGSLTSGHVPTAFKKARVIPILKKPALDPSDISNYRPNNLHDPNQSGFKAAHSTETALLAVTEKLHSARSAKLSSVLILLALSAAFDTVNQKTLLSTLRSLGICGTAWEWFASYLDGRSYQVTWKGLTSAPRRLSTGAPQGSVLGPLLFSLYTHSLGKVISSHGFSYHCYADDTQLIFSFPPSDTTTSARISACLADISSWMTAHQLKLNPSKTELLIIPGVATANHLSPPIPIFCILNTCTH